MKKVKLTSDLENVPVIKKVYKASRNRTMGHDGERHYSTEFKRMGFTFTKTSRAASRLHDDSGIDLCFTDPFNVQIKTGAHKGLNVARELRKIRDEIPKNFPLTDPVHTNINILIHRKLVGRGKRRDDYDDLVTMSFSDFEKLIKMSNKDG